MKIHIEYNGTVIEYEHQPMKPERFAALCKLALAAIAGGVLLGAIRMVGIWAIVWAVGALVAVGFYRMMVESFK